MESVFKAVDDFELEARKEAYKLEIIKENKAARKMFEDKNGKVNIGDILSSGYNWKYKVIGFSRNFNYEYDVELETLELSYYFESADPNIFCRMNWMELLEQRTPGHFNIMFNPAPPLNYITLNFNAQVNMNPYEINVTTTT